MKKTLAILFALLINYSLHSQDFNTMTGDWIRVKVEYKDGKKIPSNHGANIFIRYHFTKKEVYQVLTESTIPTAYTRTGNVLKMGPILSFSIEEYTNKALTLVEANAPDPMRYYLIPTDSFQVSGRIRYPYEIVETDTIFANAPGIEPIYPKGHNEFMHSIMEGLTQQKVGFDFTYVVQKDGTIGNVTINASTNPKLDKRFIQLIKKSSGKWIPATYKHKPINVRQKGAFGFNH